MGEGCEAAEMSATHEIASKMDIVLGQSYEQNRNHFAQTLHFKSLWIPK